MLPRANMSSLYFETGNRNFDTEEILLDGELHLGAGLDGLGEGELGGDGDHGPGVELQGVGHDRQLVNGSWLGSSLWGKKLFLGKIYCQLTAKSIFQLFQVEALGRNKSGGGTEKEEFHLASLELYSDVAHCDQNVFIRTK